MIYNYETRIVVEFSNKKRASYSKKRYGELLDKVVDLSILLDRKIWNYYEEKENYIVIFYWNQKCNSVKTTKINKEYKYLLKDNYWTENHNGYFISRTNGELKYLHREIIKKYYSYDINEKVIDHIDRNRANNLLENLRIITYSGNLLNSNYRNTYYDQNRNLWRARVRYKGLDYTKYFTTEELAHKWSEDFKNKIIQQESSTTISNESRQ